MKRGLAIGSAIPVVAALLGLAAPPAGATHPASTVIVDGSDSTSDTGGCGGTTNPCNTIQAGVDHANNGDTVEVRSETYREQVVINKELDLVGTGDPDPTIVAPASPDTFTFPESDDSWEPVVFAFGGSVSSGDVSGSGIVDVDVEGFTVDGDDRDPDADRSAGILYWNVDGRIEGNVVQNMHVGGKETFGIRVDGDSDVAISRNDVSEYSRNGITINSDDATGVITNNLVVGPGTRPDGEWAPNGIQLGFGAEGSIVDNKIRDNGSRSDDASSGIIVFDVGDGAKVSGNNLRRNELSIAFFFADDGEVTGNTVHSQVLNSDGIRLFAADAALVSDNEVEKAGDEGIQLDSTSGATVSNNRIVRAADDGFAAFSGSSGNTFTENEALGSGDLACIDTSSGEGTAGTANTWTDNTGTSPSDPARLCPRRGQQSSR